MNFFGGAFEELNLYFSDCPIFVYFRKRCLLYCGLRTFIQKKLINDLFPGVFTPLTRLKILIRSKTSEVYSATCITSIK